MQGFEPITLTWKGAEYTIPADQMLLAVAEMESAIRGRSSKQAIEILLQDGGPTFAQLSLGYASALQSAGAAVTGDEVYLSMQEGMAKGNTDVRDAMQNAVVLLVSMMSPPIALAMQEAVEEEKKKAPADS